jgi:integrase
MAERPQSRARGAVRDVRAFEEKRVLKREHVAALMAYLFGIINVAALDAVVLAEDSVWLPLRNAFLIAILLLTGLRRFECCALSCGDIDLANGRLWVIGKGRAKDFVPLPAMAITLLTKWLDLKRRRGESTICDAALFAVTGRGAGGFLSLSALRLVWKGTLAACGVPQRYGLHSARHAAGMLIFAETGSIEKTARFLRHRSVRVTSEFYLHLDADELRRELSEIDLWREP